MLSSLNAFISEIQKQCTLKRRQPKLAGLDTVLLTPAVWKGICSGWLKTHDKLDSKVGCGNHTDLKENQITVKDNYPFEGNQPTDHQEAVHGIERKLWKAINQGRSSLLVDFPFVLP